MLTGLGLKGAPVSDDVGTVAVNFEPGDCFGQDCSVEERALGAGAGLRIEQPRLQRENLLQAFNVAPGNREQTQLDPINSRR